MSSVNKTTNDKNRVFHVLLVDDHEWIRQGLVDLLTYYQDIVVVGTVADGLYALNQVDKLQPDVVLMDINLPGINGVELTRIIRSRHSNIRIIGFSMHHYLSFAMREAGAEAFLLKGRPIREILEAIRATPSIENGN